MIALPTNIDIFLFSQPTDMRKSFCGLAGIVRDSLQREPKDGSLFLFINRNNDKLKALYWGRDGLALWYKRLESGTFERITDQGKSTVQIDAEPRNVASETPDATEPVSIADSANPSRNKRFAHPDGTWCHWALTTMRPRGRQKVRVEQQLVAKSHCGRKLLSKLLSADHQLRQLQRNALE